MNRTKNTIGWCDWTWNPVTGCEHGCWYCYAKKLAQRFPKVFPNGFAPTFHANRLSEPSRLMKPSRIFVCSIADLFAPWTPNLWRDAVLYWTFSCAIPHTFQLLTKNPERIPKIVFPANVWVGTTVTGEHRDWRNIVALNKRVAAKIRFVSFEPLLDDIPFRHVSLRGIQWVIIGKLTGSRRVRLQWSWVEHVLAEADRHGIPVFMKNNLKPLPHGATLRQEFPKEKIETKKQGMRESAEGTTMEGSTTTKSIRCPDCFGNGHLPTISKNYPCQTCAGTGKLTTRDISSKSETERKRLNLVLDELVFSSGEKTRRWRTK